MLKIEKNDFKIKFTEVNIRQRMYEKESYITLMINTEFYPSLIEETVISGSIEIKLDLKNIKSLQDLINKEYDGDIGNVTISINNNGVWESDSKDKFSIKIKEINNKEIYFELKTENCTLKTTGTLVSLYTTSTSKEDLEKYFDLSEFHQNPIIKDIGNSKIYKYYLK